MICFLHIYKILVPILTTCNCFWIEQQQVFMDATNYETRIKVRALWKVVLFILQGRCAFQTMNVQHNTVLKMQYFLVSSCNLIIHCNYNFANFVEYYICFKNYWFDCIIRFIFVLCGTGNGYFDRPVNCRFRSGIQTKNMSSVTVYV